MSLDQDALVKIMRIAQEQGGLRGEIYGLAADEIEFLESALHDLVGPDWRKALDEARLDEMVSCVLDGIAAFDEGEGLI